MKSEFDALFSREQKPMLGLATLIVGSVALAEEVVQDAFLAVDQRWDELDRPGGYLRASVVNGCRAVLRRRVVEQRFEAGQMLREVEELPTHLVELAEALEQLNQRQRVVVVLRYLVDLPDDEISEILGCRPSTVRSLSRRAIAVLRKELT